MTSPRKVSEEQLNKVKLRFKTDNGLLYIRNKRGVYRQTGKYRDQAGRHTVNFDGNIWYVHRIIYFLHYGYWPDRQYVDHKDGNKSNNNPSNLRLLSHHDNMRSYNKPTKGSTSLFRGVSFSNEKGLWVTQITSDYKRVFRGYFYSELEAALSYNHRALDLGFNPESFNQVFEDVSQEVLDVET